MGAASDYSPATVARIEEIAETILRASTEPLTVALIVAAFPQHGWTSKLPGVRVTRWVLQGVRQGTILEAPGYQGVRYRWNPQAGPVGLTPRTPIPIEIPTTTRAVDQYFYRGVPVSALSGAQLRQALCSMIDALGACRGLAKKALTDVSEIAGKIRDEYGFSDPAQDHLPSG
jgi:hypothetical protein